MWSVAVARNICRDFGSGWSIKKELATSLICTKGHVSEDENCNTCETWRMIVWEDGGKDHTCSETVSTKAGKIYGGHPPCTCGDNHLTCNVGMYIWCCKRNV